jgi:hypothetical protein
LLIGEIAHRYHAGKIDIVERSSCSSEFGEHKSKHDLTRRDPNDKHGQETYRINIESYGSTPGRTFVKPVKGSPDDTGDVWSILDPEPKPECNPLPGQRNNLSESGMKLPFLVRVVRKFFVLPPYGKPGAESHGGKPRENRSDHAILWFYQEPFLIPAKLNPGVASPVTAMLSEDNACLVAQLQKLPPCPEGEVITIPLLSLLELVRRLPVVLLAELLFVRNAFATAQKPTNLFNTCALG